MDIVFTQADRDYDDLLQLCDDNYNLMTFVLKRFALKEVKPSKIFYYIENRDTNNLANATSACMDLKYSEIKDFKQKFISVSPYDDYGLYKLVYTNIMTSEEIQKKYTQEIRELKKIIKANKSYFLGQGLFVKKGK